MTFCGYEWQCRPNAMMRHGDVRGLFYVWDMLFCIFVLDNGEVLERDSIFLVLFSFDYMI